MWWCECWAWEAFYRHGPITKTTRNYWKQSTCENKMGCAISPWKGMPLKWSSTGSYIGSGWHWYRQGCPLPRGELWSKWISSIHQVSKDKRWQAVVSKSMYERMRRFLGCVMWKFKRVVHFCKVGLISEFECCSQSETLVGVYGK